ncbi:hypothetical protein MMC34_005167 [Xylographa carneopallida]|nr:hypothetical protein [Xylographa carneopallida]
MARSYKEITYTLSELQNQELSIIRLSESISAANTPDAPKRTSDVSSDAFEDPSPASLAADLDHYKELFSKLRFSYLEQVTKEKFLRAIVGDPPQIIEQQENVELEAQLVAVKADLKVQKADVAALVEELEARGRELSRRYENISLQTAQLSDLPAQISSLQENLVDLDARQTKPSTNPSLSLPLPATLEVITSRQAELDELNKQLRNLQQSLPRKTRELELLEKELKPLEAQKASAVVAAQEARRIKEEVERGFGDELELKGRWYRSVETGLREMLAVEA